ncbi:hypothetical protein HY025_05870 [Candidatus Daviesbacteria bacterium]|nr:hypothetical protein [Candidatus Daviesbacteria bacterium]
MNQFKTFLEAENYLISKIPQNYNSKYQGNWGLDRLKYFLKLLDNPQEKIKVIHIAGTSGKGSTSYLISHLLISLGKTTGLYQSPHIVNLRERFQINNKLVSEQKFINYLNKLIPIIEKTEKSDFGELSFFEITTALAFDIFYQDKLDYAVIETGLGGLFDATNAVNNPNKLSVITRIGLDHTDILGDTIDKIAVQKAGIIQQKNLVITVLQQPKAQKIIQNTVTLKSAHLYTIEPLKNYKIIESNLEHTLFNFNFLDQQLNNLSLSMIGDYQIENASLALVAVIILSNRDKFLFHENKIRQALNSALFIGRFEIYKLKNKILIVDGAHNPQKMESLVSSLKKIFPNTKFEFLTNFVKGKDSTKMLKTITPLAAKIIITEFAVVQHGQHNSESADFLTQQLDQLNFNNYQVIKNPNQALKSIINDSQKKVVITGSLYLISAIYPKLSKLKND